MTAAKATAPAAKSRNSARSAKATRKTRADGARSKPAAAVSGDAKDSSELEQLGSDVHSVTAREPLRSRLAGDVEAFLAQGGNIVEVPKDYRADPPKRPQSTYGRGSI